MQEYKLYYAQSLFKAGLYEPAMKACQNVDEAEEPGRGRVLKLQARQPQNRPNGVWAGGGGEGSRCGCRKTGRVRLQKNYDAPNSQK